MVDKVWITTNAVDNNNLAVPAQDATINPYFGFAKYNEDGTFKMYTSEGKVKMQGDWSMSDDGKKRHIVAKKDDGSTLFERTVDNVLVEDNMYTYRIYIDRSSTDQYSH